VLEDVANMHSLNVDTVGKIRSILSAIFTYAIGKGDFPARSAAENPASRSLIPEAATEPKQTIAAVKQDVKAILAHLHFSRMEPAVRTPGAKEAKTFLLACNTRFM
jgi:hypothetical protein